MQEYESIHIQNSIGTLYGLRDQEKPLFRSNISPKRNMNRSFPDKYFANVHIWSNKEGLDTTIGTQ